MQWRSLIARPRRWLAIGLISSIGIGASAACGQQAAEAERPAEEQTEQREGTPRAAPALRVEVKTIYTSPAAEPQPALEHRFWPNWNELEAGNAVPLYLRAVIMLTSGGEQERWQEYAKFAEEGMPEPDDAKGMKAARLWLGHGYQSIFNEIRRATYREEADYGHRIEEIPGTEHFQYLLPEVQEIRSLARLLDVRIRVAIADRDYDEAVALLRDGFRLAGSMRENRLLISQFVSAAIAGMMLENVRLLSEAPDAPNLYWALASLPRPLVSLRSSIAFEADLAQRMLPEQLKAPIGAEGWNEYLIDVLTDLYQVTFDGASEQPWMRRINITTMVMQAYPTAKATLVADGLPEAKVEAMPVAEVVARHLRHQVRRMGDDVQKWTLLPPEVRQFVEASPEDLLVAASREHDAALDLARLFLNVMPAIGAASRLEPRYQSQLDALMTIEAIRAHAAVHDGRLPERLDQLEPLPALPDPRTGEPFEWEVRTQDGVTEGILRLEDFSQPGWTREYHVRIQPTDD